MRFSLTILTLSLLLLLGVGCSDKQKDADRLEQEMKEMEASGAEADSMTTDSATPDMAMADAQAVPEEEAMPEVEAMPDAPAGGGYTVQVASCEDENYARYLVDVYTNRGYEPFVQTANVDGVTVYRVRVGSFEGIGQAAELKAELLDKYSFEGWIAPIE